MENDTAIVIFTKNPEPGKVKTRLIPYLGETHATQLYCHLIKHTINTTINSNLADVCIFTTPSTSHPFLLDFQTRYELSIELQQGNDLGMRMHHAFETTLTKYNKCILIGCDCPELNSHILQTSIEKLDEHDVVLGPANDGGYYLIGLKKPNIKLFQDIAWGSEQVFDNTKQKIIKEDLHYIELEQLIDIDGYEDLMLLNHIKWLRFYIN